ncbi:hypothetical protein FBZ90_108146 [Nitrospirillum pindoramense]|uniref:Uncharacterized protein n=1 Tax=Nitrospirillum amazonense TaxID=28077 RepID=A0A560H4A1_9PROT|nr:hypothetical protein FBZ90_108146 [Nitrospirillum amazonense]
MRRPLPFSPGQGYPAGKKISYECLSCSDTVPSMPAHFAECRCGNITVDSSSGRAYIRRPEEMRIYQTQ